MENPIRFALIGLALLLLALLPAFYMAYRLSRKQQKQGELAAFNAEVDKKRAQKKAQRKAKASEKSQPLDYSVIRAERNNGSGLSGDASKP